MKKVFAIIGLLAFCGASFAQDAQKEEKQDSGYVFTNTKVLPITSVKDQHRAGTCWCYSGLAFIEAELLRMNKGTYDFSEMYIVENTYNDRAMAAIRTSGDVSFSQGGSFYDVIYICEVSFAVAIVEDLYRFASDEFLRSREVEHVRSSCRTIYSKESQSC